MESVLDYLSKQSDITLENRNNFKEKVIEYDRKNPETKIWDRINSFIQQTGDNNDEFLTLLDADYRDLSLWLFEDKNNFLNDFEFSDSNSLASHEDNHDVEMDHGQAEAHDKDVANQKQQTQESKAEITHENAKKHDDEGKF